MLEAAKEFLVQQEEIYEKRRTEILNAKDEIKICGNVYYISNDGDDSNDGTTPEKAWKTLKRVNGSWLNPGDGVLFRRGDLWRGTVETKPGVTYAAYGEGKKPSIYSWDENLADASLWEEYDREHHIWKYTKKISDPGTLVFNEGVYHSRKHIPTYKNLGFVFRDDE